MFSKIPRFMNQDELDKKVSYYLVRVVEAVKSKDLKTASKASESLNQLSTSTLNNAIFRLSMIEAMHKNTALYKDSPACIDYICEHLPVYLSLGSDLLVSSNPSTALCLAQKIMRKHDGSQENYGFGTGIINNAGLVANAMAKHKHALAMTIVLDAIINYEDMSNSNLSVSLDLIKPLLAMKDDPVIQSYVKNNKQKLISVVQIIPCYLAEFSGPEIMFSEAIELADLGSPEFAKAVFQENHVGLRSNMPIDFIVQAGKYIGCTFDDLINMSNHTFTNGYGKSNPYKDDFFKYFAYYYIHSTSNFLPFVSARRKNETDDDFDFFKILVELDNPDYLKGLRHAIKASDPEKESRVHELINSLKEMTTRSDILAALAAELPDEIISHHKDLNRTRLHSDLGM